MNTSDKVDTGDSARPSNYTPRLHNLLSSPDIQLLHEAFVGGRTYRENDLREMLGQFGINFTDSQMRRLFLCINTNRDQKCSWDEFVSHLLHEFRDDETYEQGKPLDYPIEEDPVFIKSQHRYPIIKIRFCPTVNPDRTVIQQTGNYITCSKDGTLIYWNQDWISQYTAKSTNPNLKVTKTWLTDFIPMPDIRMLCTSSIERDLRFYDTTAQNFHPRLIIIRVPYHVTCMTYYFGETEAVDCRIICGDSGGNVLLLEFNPTQRGPFQIRTGGALTQISWEDVVNGGLSGMRARIFLRVHKDMVRQVEYSVKLNAIFSAAECRTIDLGRKAPPGLVITELGISHKVVQIRVPKGVTTFAFNPDCSMIVTGGPDSMLRLWNHIIPNKAQAILTGHHDGITFLFLQDAINRIYSVDRVRFIKVWDGIEFTLLQTYIAVGTALHTDRLPYAALYNDNRRALVLAGAQIISVHCRPLLQLDKTDGFTHMKVVSVCLYNSLFRSVITCCYSSMIIVWDPLTSTRRQVIRQAHTRKAYGEVLRVEITAGTFDPKEQLLLTGARDGSLRVWNVNAGTCVRNLSIEPMCEVTCVLWLNERILVLGWNMHVTEFSDTQENEFGAAGKEWDTLHSDDISCTAIYQPYIMATGSYASELVFWKLETGQPYRRIDVDSPTLRLKLNYEGAKVKLVKEDPRKSRASVAKMAMSRRTVRSIIVPNSAREEQGNAMPSVFSRTKQISSQKAERQRNLSIVGLPQTAMKTSKTAVHALLFLTTREMSVTRGTLVVALSTGFIQMYTHSPFAAKPFLQSFNAVHMAGDAITALATDKENRFLVTGTSLGYIKTWMIRNYCIPQDERIHINMPALRLQYPFMTCERIMGRAKRTVKHLSNPILVNSFKAHLLSVTNVVYMDEARLMLSSSSDRSARMWTLNGRYIGTFGSPVHWQPLIGDTPPPADYPFRMPPDIKRVMSSTTLKVLQGGYVEDPMSVQATQIKTRARELENLVKPGEVLRTYGKSLPAPILGKDFALPEMQRWQPNYELDLSMANIPIFKHLHYETANHLKRPKEPAQLKHRRAQIMFVKPVNDDNGDPNEEHADAEQQQEQQQLEQEQHEQHQAEQQQQQQQQQQQH